MTSNWQQYKLQIFYHYAPIWYEGNFAYFVRLLEDDQQMALISLDDVECTVDRETLLPRKTRKNVWMLRSIEYQGSHCMKAPLQRMQKRGD